MNSIRILLIAPMVKEYHCAREVFGAGEVFLAEGIRFAVKELKGINLHILQCGYKVSEALTVYNENLSIPDILIDSGTCGALIDTIDVLDLVNIEAVYRKDRPDLSFDRQYLNNAIKTVTLVETSSAVDSQKSRVELASLADVCSMESYSICKIASEWKCSCFSFRSITDLAGDSLKSEFKKNIRPACIKLYSYIATILYDLSH